MRYSITLIFLFAILLATGCSIKAKPPALHDFGITRTIPDNQSIIEPDITVDGPKWLIDNRIRYRLLYAAPTQVRFYALDRWIAPPTELLEQRLKSSGKNLTYPLVIRLLEFEQQFDSLKQAKALLRFSAEAYSADQKNKIGTQEFRLERITKTPDAAGAVTAFSELALLSAERLQHWLSGLSEK